MIPLQYQIDDLVSVTFVNLFNIHIINFVYTFLHFYSIQIANKSLTVDAFFPKRFSILYQPYRVSMSTVKSYKWNKKPTTTINYCGICKVIFLSSLCSNYAYKKESRKNVECRLQFEVLTIRLDM